MGSPSMKGFTLMEVIIACAIIALCIIGAYAINNSLFDVGLMLGFGLFGYWLAKAGVSPAPMVIGLIIQPHRDINTSAGMPRPTCSFRIIDRLRGRFLESTSDTLESVPKYGTMSFLLSFS